MKDEEYVFYQDLREKKTTGYSARKQRTHCGKSGRVRFPSDNLTLKEIKNMSGECKSYRLNEPMTFAEFKALPDDLKVAYILAIKAKYNAPNVAIADMMGTTKDALYLQMKRLDLAHGTKGPKKWDAEGFFNWWKGIRATKEEPVEEVEEYQPVLEKTIEEETPVDECPYKEIPNPGIKVNLIKEESAPAMAIPHSGSLSFEGKTRDILTTLGVLLGGGKHQGLCSVGGL